MAGPVTPPKRSFFSSQAQARTRVGLARRNRRRLQVFKSGFEIRASGGGGDYDNLQDPSPLGGGSEDKKKPASSMSSSTASAGQTTKQVRRPHAGPPQVHWSKPADSTSGSKDECDPEIKGPYCDIDEAVRETYETYDTDGDGVLSIQEFQAYVDAQDENANAPITWSDAMGLGLRASIRTVGLGAVDTAILLLCGDAIENMLAASMNLTTLGAVGIASIVSSVVGLAFGGYLEMVIEGRLPPLELSVQQMERPLARNADLLGACLGVVVGCLVGFLPIIAQGKFFRSESARSTLKSPKATPVSATTHTPAPRVVTTTTTTTATAATSTSGYGYASLSASVAANPSSFAVGWAAAFAGVVAFLTRLAAFVRSPRRPRTARASILNGRK